MRSCSSPESKIERRLDQLESSLSYSGENPSNIRKMASLQAILGLMDPEVVINVRSQNGRSIQLSGKDSIRDIYMAARSEAQSLQVKFGLRSVTLVSENKATSASEAMVRANPGNRTDVIAVQMEWTLKDGSWLIRSISGESKLK